MLSIKGYEGRYSVTEDGKVFSHINGIFLKPKKLNNGYLRVSLVSHNGKTHQYLVHRLVCAAFYPDGSGDVNHIDCDKENNAASNLEWCSRKENMEHASKNNLLSKQSKRMAAMNKERCSIPVVGFSKTGEVLFFCSMSEAEKAGFNHTKISNCIHGKRMTHKGLQWRIA